MNSLTRRRFLTASGVSATVATGAALGWFELIDRARTDPLPTDAHVLVMLTLYGGNDGLGTVIIAGQPVTGGFYGDQPSLTDLDDGDLKTTTDFRDTYATLLAKVLNTDPTHVLGPGRAVATYL